MAHANNWLLIFLVYANLRKINDGDADNSNDEQSQRETQDALKNLYEDARLSVITDRVKVVIIFNRVRSIKRLVGGVIRERKGDDDKTYLFELQKRLDPNGKPNNKFKLVDKPLQTAFPFQKPDTLRSLFSRIGTDPAYGADKTLLFTWDHGSVYGIFEARNIDELDMVARANTFSRSFKKHLSSAITFPVSIPVLNAAYTRHSLKKDIGQGFFSNILEKKASTNDDGEELDILTNEELARAIREGFPQKKVNVLIMMNCCMMNLLTLHALKEEADYIVAPQSVINQHPGYNYRAIIDSIMMNPEPDAIAVTAVESIRKNPRFEGANGTALKRETEKWAIFAYDMNEYRQHVFTEINKVVTNLFIDLSRSRARLKNSRLSCYPFDSAAGVSADMVELITYLSFVNKAFQQTSGVLNNIKSFDEIFPKVKKAEHKGSIYYNRLLPRFQNNQAPSGLSMFFPKEKPNAPFIQNPDLQPLFFQETEWVQFLTALHKPGPSPVLGIFRNAGNAIRRLFSN